MYPTGKYYIDICFIYASLIASMGGASMLASEQDFGNNFPILLIFIDTDEEDRAQFVDQEISQL